MFTCNEDVSITASLADKHFCCLLSSRGTQLEPACLLLSAKQATYKTSVLCILPHCKICIPAVAAELLQQLTRQVFMFHPHLAGELLLPVQSAAPQLDSDQKPELASSTLRRRQSFNFANSRLGSLLPAEAGLAQRGQLSGDPNHHSSTTAVTVPPVPARQESATAGPPRKVAMAQIPAPVPGLQPAVAAKLAQPAQKQKLKTAVMQKTAASSVSKPKPDLKAQTTLPAKSVGGQSVQRTPIGGEATRAQRQGSSLTQLVEKYKTDSAARKQVHNEVTLERINSLAAGRQQAASGRPSGASFRAPSSVPKQAAGPLAAFASNSRTHSATQDKVAAGAKPEAANAARPLQVDSKKSMKSTAKGKASLKSTAGASGARFHKKNTGTRSSSSSDSDF